MPRARKTERGILSLGGLLLLPHFEHASGPWPQIIGYVLSLVLTLAATLLVVHHLIAPLYLPAVILLLAVMQAGIQLGLFMHLREGVGPSWQIAALVLAGIVALGIVIFSIWIMAFKSGVS